MKMGENEVTLTDYFYSKETVERIFKDAGFINHQWFKLVMREGLSEEIKAKWNWYLEMSPTLFFKAIKA